MKKLITRNPDRSLTVNVNDGETVTNIEAGAVPLFRRDPDFESALPDEIRAQLDADQLEAGEA